MTFSEYQEKTANTAIYPNGVELLKERVLLRQNGHDKAAEILTNIGVFYCGLGLGEAGEVQGKLKKILRDSGGFITPEMREKIGDEIADNLWYLSQLSTELGLSLDTLAEKNIAKLKSRQERGKLQGSGDER